MRPKVLMCIRLPQPVHGESLMNTYIINSKLLNENFILDSIDIKSSKTIEDFNKVSIQKVIHFFKVYYKFITRIILFRPDFVYISLSPVGISFYKDSFYIIIAKLFQKKVALHLHGKGIENSVNKNRVNNILYKIILKNTYCICLSNSLKSDVKQISYKKDYILNNAIPAYPESLTPVKKRLNEEIIIIFLSNLVKEKGILTFLEVCVELNKRSVPFKALIAGKPFDVNQNDLKEFINQNNLEKKVEYVGPKYSEDKMHFLQQADVMLFPTKYKNETFSLVLLEAMQFGVIPISSNEGGIPEMYIDGVHGVLADSNDVQKMTLSIQQLQLNNKEFYKMSEACKIHFQQNYTLSVYERKMVDIFYNIHAC